jgi:hypothetical protein
MFLLTIMSRPAMETTNLGTREYLPGEKRLEREADHSPPSVAGMKNS